MPTIVGDYRRIDRFHEISGSLKLIKYRITIPTPYVGGTLLRAVFTYIHYICSILDLNLFLHEAHLAYLPQLTAT